jgi:DNA repair protein SbcD/Mre11
LFLFPVAFYMKILHTADIHLRDDHSERWEALQKIIGLCKKESVDAMVISGDLFDADIDALKLKGKLRELFSNIDHDIYVIPGNHDEKSFGDRAFFGSRVKVIRSLQDRYETDDAVITGVPFKNIKDRELYGILQNISGKLNDKKCNILLYHGELLDSYYSRHDFGEEGDSRYMPVRLDYFTELKFDYILAGHFHTNFNILEFDKENGSGYFVYSGSPASITKRETGKRKVNIFNTMEAPAEVPVDSFFYEAINIKLNPFDEMDPVSAIRQRLVAVDKHAKILLKLEGYLNSAKHNIDETKLNEELVAMQDRKEIEEAEFKSIDLRRILEDDIFRNFELKLKSSDIPAHEKAGIREIFLKAMMESVA